MVRERRPGVAVRVAAAALVSALLLSGCQAWSPGADGTPDPTVAGVSTQVDASPSPSPQARPLITITPGETTDVRPDRPVTVSLVNGELDTVALSTTDGAEVGGEVDSTGTWRNTDPLTADTAYTLTATAHGTDGATTSRTATFRTIAPGQLVRTTLIPGDDWNVGVGMPVIAVFSRPVTNRAAAEAAMTVTSTPAVEGGWRWFSSTEAHWRPADFWPAGAKVTVRAATSGVELADGAWGKRTVTTNFTVASKQVMTVDMAKHTLTFTRDGSTVRTIPVTTGKKGYDTRNGIKVVMDRQSEVRMDAATTGVDSTDPDYYDLQVKYAMRLTWSGEYLHAAPWSVGSQGRANVSHGCTGMSTANAKWLFDNTRIGDVVVFKNGRRSLEWGNGYTDWNMPLSEYVQG